MPTPTTRPSGKGGDDHDDDIDANVAVHRHHRGRYVYRPYMPMSSMLFLVAILFCRQRNGDGQTGKKDTVPMARCPDVLAGAWICPLCGAKGGARMYVSAACAGIHGYSS
jgi:hypothetical protein